MSAAPTSGGGNKGSKVARMPSAPTLSAAHRTHLYGSGLSDASIDAGGFYSEARPAALSELLGGRWAKARGAGLVIPFFEPGALEPHLMRVRPDKPRQNKKTGKIVKYEQPRNTPTVPYFPAGSRGEVLRDTSVPVVFTEGEKKAALLDQLGLCAIGAVGVSCFHDVAHRADHDVYRLHPWIREHVALRGREALIVFDSDAADNDQVMRAAQRLAGMLNVEGASVRFVAIPGGEDGSKLGIDDYFVKFGEEATRQLLKSAGLIEGLPVSEVYTLVGQCKALREVPEGLKKLRIPAGYEVGRRGELFKKGGEAAPEMVERSPILISRVLTGLASGEKQIALVFHDGERWREVMVGRKAIADARTAISEFAPLGAPIDSVTASKVITWLRDFEAVNAKKLERACSVDRCGWHEGGRFMLNRAVLPEGSEEIFLNGSGGVMQSAKGLGVGGTEALHLEALREAWAASRTAALMIAGSLAAPLIYPLRGPRFAIHLFGDSSRGKSSMHEIAASVYGDPTNPAWVTQWDGSLAGNEVWAQLFCDLPLCIDEAGVTDSRVRDRAIYKLIAGVSKKRSNRDVQLREFKEWRCVVLSTGETMLAGSESATGAQVRVLQYEVRRFGAFGAGDVERVRDKARANFGHAGRRWIESLVGLDSEWWEEQREQYRGLMRRMRSKSPGRLRSRQIGYYALLAAAEHLAAQLLGIGQSGGQTIMDLFESGEDLEEVRPAADRAIEALGELLVARGSAFPELVVDTNGHKTVKGGRLPSEVMGYLDPTRGEVLILRSALKRELASVSIDSRIVLQDWRERDWIDAPETGTRFTKERRIHGKKGRFVVLRSEPAGLGVAGVATSEFQD